MSVLLQRHGTDGFYKAPISKAMIGGLFFTSCTLNIPLFSHLKRHLVCSVHAVLSRGELWKLIMRNVAFLSVKDLLCGCLLIYYLRIFERRLGSQKFASHILGTCILSTVIEISAAFLSNKYLDVDISYLPCGPYGLIFPLLVDFYYDIPRVKDTNLFGIPISGKSFVYLIALQILSDSKVSLLTCFSCLLAGAIYRANFCKIQQIVKIPNFCAKVFDGTIGKLISSSRPKENIMMGATLELQRQQIMDMMEQAALSRQMRQIENQTRSRIGQGYAETLVNESNNGQQNNERGRFGISWLRQRTNQSLNSSAVIEAPVEVVNTLVEMGFQRPNVIAALRNSNNDVTMATNILLNES